MGGPYLWLRAEFGSAIEGGLRGHCWLALECLGFQELACGWAGHPPYRQGFRVRTEQGMGCV